MAARAAKSPTAVRQTIAEKRAFLPADIYTFNYSVDLFAERNPMPGQRIPGSYEEFGQMTRLQEAAGTTTNAKDMIRQLLADNKTVVRTAQNAIRAAETVSDQATMNLLTQRKRTPEKTAGMLRSPYED